MDPLDDMTCGAVYAGDDAMSGWHYYVTCRQFGHVVRGWKLEKSAAVAEAHFWVKNLGCDCLIKID